MIPSDRFACQPIGIVVLCPGFIGIYINLKFFCNQGRMVTVRNSTDGPQQPALSQKRPDLSKPPA